MKKNKLNQYEAQTSLEPSPEQIQQAREWAVNRMMEVVDKLPANPAPVKESFAELAELARQANSGVKLPKKSTLIISGGSLEVPKKSTDIDIEAPKKFTDIDIEAPKKFTDFEMELLRQIQENAE
jgi:hypothetical protein